MSWSRAERISAHVHELVSGPRATRAFTPIPEIKPEIMALHGMFYFGPLAMKAGVFSRCCQTPDDSHDLVLEDNRLESGTPSAQYESSNTVLSISRL